MSTQFNYERQERVLTISDLSVRYGENMILRNVNAAVNNVVRPGVLQGQVVALLGPSGVGKTTLFRCLAGLESPTQGVVSVTEQQCPVQAGMVGVVPQTYTLFKHRTVLGNLLVAAEKRLPKADALKRSLELLGVYGLLEKKSAYPRQLSGGQRQRVCIMQQILSSGHFLLMDEPFSGLDPLMKDKTCETILKLSLVDELNTTIVVTHDIESAVTIADTVWLMGRSFDEHGKSQGAAIRKEYDLIEAGLAWQPNIATLPLFHEMVQEIKAEFKFC